MRDVTKAGIKNEKNLTGKLKKEARIRSQTVGEIVKNKTKQREKLRSPSFPE